MHGTARLNRKPRARVRNEFVFDDGTATGTRSAVLKRLSAVVSPAALRYYARSETWAPLLMAHSLAASPTLYERDRATVTAVAGELRRCLTSALETGACVPLVVAAALVLVEQLADLTEAPAA